MKESTNANRSAEDSMKTRLQLGSAEVDEVKTSKRLNSDLERPRAASKGKPVFIIKVHLGLFLSNYNSG
jgi:hypothetical protein